MMPRNPLVIRDRLHRRQRPLCEVVRVHIRSSRPLPIRTPLVVVSRSLIFLDKCRHSHDLQLSLGQRPEQARQLRLHLRDVASVSSQQSLLRSRMLLWIRLQGRAEALQIGETQLMHNRQHLRLVALHLIQPNLVNLSGGFFQRRALPYPVRIVGIAIRQSPRSRVLASLRHILHLQKLCESLIVRQHLRPNRLQQLIRNPTLGRGIYGLWNLLQGQRKRTIRRLLVRQCLCLRHYLLKQILRRHPPLVYTQLHVGRDLREGRRNLFQPSDIVVVVLHRIELQVVDQPWQLRVEAAELVHRHLPLLELRPLLVVDQRAQHQLRRQPLLVRQPRRVDLAQPLNEPTPARQRRIHLLRRVVRELIVIPLVAKEGGKLRRVLQPVLPYLREQLRQVLASLSHRSRSPSSRLNLSRHRHHVQATNHRQPTHQRKRNLLHQNSQASVASVSCRARSAGCGAIQHPIESRPADPKQLRRPQLIARAALQHLQHMLFDHILQPRRLSHARPYSSICASLGEWRKIKHCTLTLQNATPHKVLHLADIPRPAIPLQPLYGVVRNSVYALLVKPCEPAQKVHRQLLNILHSLPQGRQRNPHHGDLLI